MTNKGNEPAPHMLLYHCNFGWPLIDEGTTLHCKGDWQAGDSEMSNKIFANGNDFRSCPPPMEEHAGGGEAVAFINAIADPTGYCSCGIYNAKIRMALSLRFPKKQLPWLINWQHWGKGEYVTALEPATNPPIGQAKARENQELIFLQPGETRTYDLEIEILDQEDKINAFLKSFN